MGFLDDEDLRLKILADGMEDIVNGSMRNLLRTLKLEDKLLADDDAGLLVRMKDLESAIEKTYDISKCMLDRLEELAAEIKRA